MTINIGFCPAKLEGVGVSERAEQHVAGNSQADRPLAAGHEVTA
ncbi:hypothetical protein [Salinispora pacifica]|nr:hypothetical protein [Salinispora pacifica]